MRFLQTRSQRRIVLAALLILLTPVVLPPSVSAQEMPGVPPTAEDDYAWTESTASLTVDVLANDYGNSAPLDPTTVTILEPTATGTVTVDPLTGEIGFTPDAGASVIDYLVYEVSDQDGLVSNPAFLWIDVMHEAPVVEDDFEMTSYIESITVDVLSNDFSGTAPIDPGTVTVVTSPSHGTTSVDTVTGQITYTPDGDYSGDDWFEYTVEDDYGVTSGVARVDIMLMNVPPEITFFDTWYEGYGIWVFEGMVQDERPETVQIDFGGLLSGSTTADATGYFTTSVSLPPGCFGAGTATATDEFGLQDGPKYAEVYPY